MPLLRELIAMGLGGLEVYYRTFQPETVTMVGAVAATLGLLATGGSDYHGDLMPYAEAHAVARTSPRRSPTRPPGRGSGRMTHAASCPCST